MRYAITELGVNFREVYFIFGLLWPDISTELGFWCH